MKNKNTAELRNLAKNLKASAVKVSKAVKNCPKNAKMHREGRHNVLPTDTDWSKLHYGVFDAMKGDRGDNRAVCAALVQLKHSKKFGIR